MQDTQAAISNSCTLGQGSGREIFERRGVRLGHAIEDRGLDRWPCAHTCPPVGDRRVALPNAAELEQFEPQYIGNNGAIRIGEGFRRLGTGHF